jgi:hypothetical protein
LSEEDEWEDNIMSALNDMAGNLKKIGGIHCNQAGPDSTEVQLKLNLPVPMQYMDQLDVAARQGFNTAMETLSPKKCNMQYGYSQLDDHVFDMEQRVYDFEQRFVGTMNDLQGNVVPVYKSLFQTQTEDSSDNNEIDEDESSYEDPRFLAQAPHQAAQARSAARKSSFSPNVLRSVADPSVTIKKVPSHIIVTDSPSDFSSAESFRLSSTVPGKKQSSNVTPGMSMEEPPWIPATKAKLSTNRDSPMEPSGKLTANQPINKIESRKENVSRPKTGPTEIPVHIACIENLDSHDEIVESYSEITTELVDSEDARLSDTNTNRIKIVPSEDSMPNDEKVSKIVQENNQTLDSTPKEDELMGCDGPVQPKDIYTISAIAIKSPQLKQETVTIDDGDEEEEDELMPSNESNAVNTAHFLTDELMELDPTEKQKTTEIYNDSIMNESNDKLPTMLPLSTRAQRRVKARMAMQANKTINTQDEPTKEDEKIHQAKKDEAVLDETIKEVFPVEDSSEERPDDELRIHMPTDVPTMDKSTVKEIVQENEIQRKASAPLAVHNLDIASTETDIPEDELCEPIKVEKSPSSRSFLGNFFRASVYKMSSSSEGVAKEDPFDIPMKMSETVAALSEKQDVDIVTSSSDQSFRSARQDPKSEHTRQDFSGKLESLSEAIENDDSPDAPDDEEKPEDEMEAVQLAAESEAEKLDSEEPNKIDTKPDSEFTNELEMEEPGHISVRDRPSEFEEPGQIGAMGRPKVIKEETKKSDISSPKVISEKTFLDQTQEKQESERIQTSHGKSIIAAIEFEPEEAPSMECDSESGDERSQNEDIKRDTSKEPYMKMELETRRDSKHFRLQKLKEITAQFNAKKDTEDQKPTVDEMEVEEPEPNPIIESRTKESAPNNKVAESPARTDPAAPRKSRDRASLYQVRGFEDYCKSITSNPSTHAGEDSLSYTGTKTSRDDRSSSVSGKTRNDPSDQKGLHTRTLAVDALENESSSIDDETNVVADSPGDNELIRQTDSIENDGEDDELHLRERFENQSKNQHLQKDNCETSSLDDNGETQLSYPDDHELSYPDDQESEYSYIDEQSDICSKSSAPSEEYDDREGEDSLFDMMSSTIQSAHDYHMAATRRLRNKIDVDAENVEIRYISEHTRAPYSNVASRRNFDPRDTSNMSLDGTSQSVLTREDTLRSLRSNMFKSVPSASTYSTHTHLTSPLTSSYTMDTPLAAASTISTMRTFDHETVNSDQQGLRHRQPQQTEYVQPEFGGLHKGKNWQSSAIPESTYKNTKKSGRESTTKSSTILTSFILQGIYSIFLFIFEFAKYILSFLYRKREKKVACAPTRLDLRQPEQIVRREGIQDRSIDGLIHRSNAQPHSYQHRRQPYHHSNQEHYMTTTTMTPGAFAGSVVDDDADEIGTCISSVVPDTHYPTESSGRPSTWKVSVARSPKKKFSSSSSIFSTGSNRSGWSRRWKGEPEEKNNWLDQNDDCIETTSYYD